MRWPISHRIVRTIYPPVDLFEDIADPADWELLVAAEAKTNPRIRDAVGNLALVPAKRRTSGPGASIVMGCFTHVSVDRPGRLTQGRYGVWSCGDRFEVALHETAHHFERFMRRTAEPAADADYRELTSAIHGDLAEADESHLDPDDWTAGQAFGIAARLAGRDGVLYRSVRFPSGQAAGLFWPDCVDLPIIQARHLRYRWNGSRMTHYLVHGPAIWMPFSPA